MFHERYCLLQKFVLEKNVLTWQDIIQLGIWFTNGLFGFIFPPFLQDRSNELSIVFNSLFTIDYIETSNLVKYLVYNSPQFSVLVSIVYGITITFTDLDPIVANLNKLEQSSTTFCLKIIFIILDTLKNSFNAIAGSLIILNGLFCGYVVLGKISTQIHSNVDKTELKVSMRGFNCTPNWQIVVFNTTWLYHLKLG